MKLALAVPFRRVDKFVLEGICVSDSQEQTRQQFSCPGIATFRESLIPEKTKQWNEIVFVS
jgi:hypothetical protein